MFTFDDHDNSIGKIMVLFTSPIQYLISHCSIDWTDLPVQPTDEVEKTWTIRKTANTLNIECNGVEVLNYQFSESSESSDVDCELEWGTREVRAIKFSKNYDDASVSYRAIPTGKLGS